MKNLIVNTASQDPIYQQLYDQIALQIIQGDLKSDSILPSIRKMAKEMRVSIITIKKTWEILERNGLIYTIAGKGSYVQKNTKASLTEMKYLTIQTKIEDTIELAKTLDIDEKELLLLVSKLYQK